MNSNDNIKLMLYIRANAAKIGPPLGTTLGNIGVNTVKFCKEFNDYTSELPNYFLLKVKILIIENKSFTFSVDLPSIGFIISMLKKEETIKDQNGVIINTSYILLEDFVKIAKFKFPNHSLKKSLKVIKGSLLSANIVIR
jgi:large subunit ribosomal protein L11